MLGNIIKKYRKASGLSVYKLAKQVNISHSYVTQIENGKRNNPNIDIIVKIAVVLNIPIEDIINFQISEFEKLIVVNKEKILKSNIEKNSLCEKLSHLSDDDKLKVEGYIDFMLQNYTDFNSNI